jgi:hypothetical protein
MEAMNHTDVFWAKKQKAVGTWENFCVSSERGSWGIANTRLVQIHLSAYFLHLLVLLAMWVNSSGSGYNIVGLLNKAEDMLYPPLSVMNLPLLNLSYRGWF